MDTGTEVLDLKAEPRAVSRTALNFWIDLATAVLFALLLGTSFLMKFVLPPGTCDDAGVKVWLGHSRHWWGDIHFWSAVLLIVLLIVHIWLHWAWVTGTWRRLLGSLKAPASWGVLSAMAALLIVPWAVPAQYLDVPEPTTTAATAGDEGSAAVAQAVAPCGVEGLSCETCPAADDRLFGGGCGGDETSAENEQSAAADETASDECADCPFSGECEEEGAGAAENEPDPAGKEA
jgi:hypothetical protein